MSAVSLFTTPVFVANPLETDTGDSVHQKSISEASQTGIRLPSIDERLVRIMSEQTDILRRIERRQAATDLSRQPIPQVPSTSSSAWNPLLKSFIEETILPKVDRWKSGLEALLVFLGLFSAIVTSFLLASLTGLTPDNTARTNELLANLTEIVIMLSRNSAVDLKFSLPAAFEPDPSSIRVNSYHSLSLVLSLSIAALAVAGRGFLNMVAMSKETGAAFRLTDIHTRWAAAEKALRPMIESLPQLLVLPVLLFIVGLLDTLLSTIFQISPVPHFILITTALCLVSITVVASMLIFTLIDGTIHPSTSAFQSTPATFMVTFLPDLTVFSRRAGIGILTLIKCWFAPGFHEQTDEGLVRTKPGLYPKPLPFQPEEIAASYQSVIQQTHEDTTLDQASAALWNILDVGPVDRVALNDIELATFTHLLSPEASLRSNVTAVSVFNGMLFGHSTAVELVLTIGGTTIEMRLDHSETHFTLLDSLLHALLRYHPRGSSQENDIWESPFTLAIASIVWENIYPGLPADPVVQILVSQSRLAKPQYDATMRDIFSLMWNVMTLKLEAAASPDIDNRSQAAQMCLLVDLNRMPPNRRWILQEDLKNLMESMLWSFSALGSDKLALWFSHCAPFHFIIGAMFHTLQIKSKLKINLAIKNQFSRFVDHVVHYLVAFFEFTGNDLLNLCILCTTNTLLSVSRRENRGYGATSSLITTLAHRALTTQSVVVDHNIELLHMLFDVTEIHRHMPSLEVDPDSYQVILNYVNAEKARMGEEFGMKISNQKVTLVNRDDSSSTDRSQWNPSVGDVNEEFSTSSDEEGTSNVNKEKTGSSISTLSSASSLTGTSENAHISGDLQDPDPGLGPSDSVYNSAERGTLASHRIDVMKAAIGQK